MNSGNYKQKKKKRLSTLPKKNYDDWTSCPPKNPFHKNIPVESSSIDWRANFVYPENSISSDAPWPTLWEYPPDDWSSSFDSSAKPNEDDWSANDWSAKPIVDDWPAESNAYDWPNAYDWQEEDWSQISNKVYDSQSEIRQEDDSKSVEDLKNKVGDCNISKGTDTIYDTLSNLSSDFLSALQKNSFTDVSIKCGDYVQQVHKFVLAARSPVFEAMFSTAMEENEKGVVTISDIDASVLDDLLAFIYGAQVKNMTESKACDLLYVAEKYQVKGLKDICTNYLRSCLSIPNAIQILQFADLYDGELKKDIMSYVCENFSVLKVTEEWKTLQKTKPNLTIDVYSMVVEKYEVQGVSKSAKNS